MRLSEHFRLSEFTRTGTGLPNQPTDEHRLSLRALCVDVLEPLRAYVGAPVRITSGYRSQAVNEAVGGSATSQHCYGDAADVKVSGWSAEELAGAVIDSVNNSRLHQVIAYHPTRGGHVHVGRGNGRCQVLYRAANGAYQAPAPEQVADWVNAARRRRAGA